MQKTAGNEERRIRVLLIGADIPDQRVSLTLPQLVAFVRAQPDLAEPVYIEWLAFTTESSDLDITTQILKAGPDVVGFSMFVWSETLLRSVIRRIDTLMPQATVIVGGAQVRGREETLINSLPQIDVVVTGEGEAILADVLRALRDGRSLAGIVGTTIRAEDGRPATSLATRAGTPLQEPPSPYLAGLVKPPEKSAYLTTAHGCPNRCGYCDFGGQRRRVRLRDLEVVRAELEWLRSRGVETVSITDPVFNLQSARAVGILRMLREFKFTGVSAQVSAELLTEELAQALADAGSIVGVGLQSTAPEACRLMRRPFHRDRFRQGIGLLKQYYVPFKLQLICGLPGDTFGGFCNSMDEALLCQPMALEAFALQVLPGTHFFAEAHQLGLAFDPDPPHLVFQTPAFPFQQLLDARAFSMVIHKLYGLSDFIQMLSTLLRAGHSPSAVVHGLTCRAVASEVVSLDELLRPRADMPESAGQWFLSHLLKLVQTQAGSAQASAGN